MKKKMMKPTKKKPKKKTGMYPKTPWTPMRKRKKK